MNRRYFIQAVTAFAGLSSFYSSCYQKKKVKGKIMGASAHVGHLLRDKKFERPSSVSKKDVVIVGGGVSGLSAAYHLQKAGISNFVLLDLEDKAGGNSVAGKNEISHYPWGAHYIPLPNNDLTEYLDFLKQHNVIAGENEDGLPVYNELCLCFDPEERLYINGQWQEGLIPHSGVPAEDKKQIGNFLALMNEYRYKKGKDGKDAFALPVNASSKDDEFVMLDNLTMKNWMAGRGFTSTYLHWYVNYCTKDDFGTSYEKASAWAGIHYFACRKGRGSNAEHQDVLTWPEGNGWLVRQLEKPVKELIQTNCLVTGIEQNNEKVIVHYFDTKTATLKAIETAQCILAVPQFVASHLLKDPTRVETVKKHFQYVPWMVANLTVKKLEERSGAPMSWDNVIYGSDSLGYVEATHQLVNQYLPKQNLTYYLPLIEENVLDARKKAQATTYEQWIENIFHDLRRIHPNIEEATEELNVHVWGHAMVQLVPGMIHGDIRRRLQTSINNRLHFAHTDLAGVSLFEEGFYQGLNAAKTVKQNMML